MVGYIALVFFVLMGSMTNLLACEGCGPEYELRTRVATVGERTWFAMGGILYTWTTKKDSPVSVISTSNHIDSDGNSSGQLEFSGIENARVTYYSSSNCGIAPGAVVRLFLDMNNVMWTISENGTISRFDGNEWKQLRTNSSGTDALTVPLEQEMYEDYQILDAEMYNNVMYLITQDGADILDCSTGIRTNVLNVTTSIPDDFVNMGSSVFSGSEVQLILNSVVLNVNLETKTAAYCYHEFDEVTTESDLLQGLKKLTVGGEHIRLHRLTDSDTTRESNSWCSHIRERTPDSASLSCYRHVKAASATDANLPFFPPRTLIEEDQVRQEPQKSKRSYGWITDLVTDLVTDNHGNVYLAMLDGVLVISNPDIHGRGATDVVRSVPYPNPANNLITIPLELNTETNVTVQVLDLSGSVVTEQRSITCERVDIDVKNLPSGTYIALVSADGRTGQRTFCIQR